MMVQWWIIAEGKQFYVCSWTWQHVMSVANDGNKRIQLLCFFITLDIWHFLLQNTA